MSQKHDAPIELLARPPTQPLLLSLQDYEDAASRLLPPMVLGYYQSGADAQVTLAENRRVFERLQLIPRVLVDVSNVDTTVTLLGHRLAMPILIAPMAMQCLAHPDGELAVARAAAARGTTMIVSTMATTSLEDVARCTTPPSSSSSISSANHHPPPLWFQLYAFKDRAATEAMVRSAEASGYQALVLTVDAPRLGKREADRRNGFHLPNHLRLANLERLVNSSSSTTKSDPSAIAAVFVDSIDASLTWDTIRHLRTMTKLPILIKGVLHPEDAKLALKYKVDGIIVSNHGGRQLDTVPSAMSMLPEICRVINRRIPVLVDGGIRRGTDVLKALALGANAVLLGRPILYGLAVEGQEGVEKVLSLLHDELILAMQLAGMTSVSMLHPGLVSKL